MDIQQQTPNYQYQMLIDHDNTQVNTVLYSVYSVFAGEITEHYQLNKDGTLLSLYGTVMSEAMEQFMRKLIAFDAISVDDTSAEVLEHVTTTFEIDQSLAFQFNKECDGGNTLISTIWREQEEEQEQADEDEDEDDQPETQENFITQITENVYIRVVRHQDLNVVFFIDSTEPEVNFRLIAMFNSRLNIRAGKPINIVLKDIPAETVNKIDELINTLCSNSFSRDYLNDNFEILTGEMFKKMFNQPE